MKKKVIILTGSETRHTFFRIFMGLQHPDYQVVKSYCEGKQGSLTSIVLEGDANVKMKEHVVMRAQSEADFFDLFIQNARDLSNPIFINKGDINLPHVISDIIQLNPDIIISYGCSIIRSSLLEHFKGKFINIHLGLSPYYRGSGTNYWPFVNNELQYVGVTFMHIDSGVDTGKIIHQIRPHIAKGDTIHSIGNRLILDMAKEMKILISCFEQLDKIPVHDIHKEVGIKGNYYKKVHFTSESLITMYENFQNGLIENYLRKKEILKKNAPIIENPNLKG